MKKEEIDKDLEIAKLKQKIKKLKQRIKGKIWVCIACGTQNSHGRINCFECGNVYE